jgi:transcription elongation GreA/GreB family factor
MPEPETIMTAADVGCEEWFLARLDDAELPLPLLFKVLDELSATGQSERAQAWGELLLDTLRERGLHRPMVELLRTRAEWSEPEKELRAACARALEAAATAEPGIKPLVAAAGFDKALPVKECLRRLELLMALQPGALCHEKTWGFGVVRRVDPFYARVEIDFSKKSGHQLSLAYAAETLELLADDHVLAVHHRTPDQVRDWIASDPAELVRACLRSYGPLNAAQLQARLVPHVLPESDWKRFWDGARKGLKKDPLFHLPAGRNDSLRLLDKPRGFNEDWFQALAGERRMDHLLDQLEKFSLADEAKTMAPDRRAVVAGRLKFVLLGADKVNAGWVARAMMLADRFGLAGDAVDIAAPREAAFSAAGFPETCRQLPARQVPAFLEFLFRADAPRTLDLLERRLPTLEISALDPALTVLVQQGREAACAQLIKKQIDLQEISVELLNWLARHMDRLEAWSLTTPETLAHLALTQLEQNYSGERLRAKNQLRERFERDDWLGPVMDGMSLPRRLQFFLRLKDTPAFPTMDRRSLLARVIKRFPDLERVMSDKPAAPAESGPRGPLTSHRSFRERQAQLEKITSVDIPANSKEIGVARSYGDLRENFEFKAAREMQRLLLLRQAELQQMLLRVRPTDFRGLPADQAGPGTGVRLRYPDGREEQYFILGEWDRDERLHIISSTTRLAEALAGHRTGEDVVVPTETGETTCRLVEVTGLTEEVQSWIDGA